jgi:sugar lactone lactonase YvrE
LTRALGDGYTPAVGLPESFRVLAPLAHCEGVATGPDGALWAGDEDGAIFRVDPESGAHEQLADIGTWALGLAADARSRLYVCAYAETAIVRVDPATGERDVYCGGLTTPNWCVFAPDGSLYVSESGPEEYDSRAGRVVRIPPGGGSFERLDLPPLAFANGMALAPDGTLYVAESFVPQVRAIRDGEATVHGELPGTVPDGLALDADGGIIVTSYQPNRVLRIPPGGGDPEVFLDDWQGTRLMTPTNAAFYGPDLRHLAVASLCGWSLCTVETPWRGQPLFYPDLP